MTQKIYIVEGRQFRSEADYQNALKDQQVIENLRMQTKKMNLSDQKKLLEVIRSGKCRCPGFQSQCNEKKGIFKEASKEKRNTET